MEIRMNKERREGARARCAAEFLRLCVWHNFKQDLPDALDTIDALESENAALRAEMDALRAEKKACAEIDAAIFRGFASAPVIDPSVLKIGGNIGNYVYYDGLPDDIESATAAMIRRMNEEDEAAVNGRA